MAVNAAALRELHRIHQQLADLNERLERGPKQVRSVPQELPRLKSNCPRSKPISRSRAWHLTKSSCS